MEAEKTCCRCGAISERRVCENCRIRRDLFRENREAAFGKPLTFRERQIIDGITRGLLNKEIAYELRLTEGTIKEYINRIFHKTGLHNRTQLAVRHLQGAVLYADRRMGRPRKGKPPDQQYAF